MNLTKTSISIIIIFLALAQLSIGQDLKKSIANLPLLSGEHKNGTSKDWLISNTEVGAGVFKNEKGNE